MDRRKESLDNNEVFIVNEEVKIDLDEKKFVLLEPGDRFRVVKENSKPKKEAVNMDLNDMVEGEERKTESTLMSRDFEVILNKVKRHFKGEMDKMYDVGKEFADVLSDVMGPNPFMEGFLDKLEDMKYF